MIAGAGFLPGAAGAAGPSYEEFVAEIKGGKLDIDYTAFRYAYAASPKFDPYGAAFAAQARAMKTAYGAGDCPAAMARAKEIMDVNFVQIDAHFVTSLCQKKAGNQEAALAERAVADGLMKSVLTSGDGKTPKSAFVVIAIDEEYTVLAILGLAPGDQSLISLDGSSFDRLDGKERRTGQAVPLFFNIDRIMKH